MSKLKQETPELLVCGPKIYLRKPDHPKMQLLYSYNYLLVGCRSVHTQSEINFATPT